MEASVQNALGRCFGGDLGSSRPATGSSVWRSNSFLCRSHRFSLSLSPPGLVQSGRTGRNGLQQACPACSDVRAYCTLFWNSDQGGTLATYYCGSYLILLVSACTRRMSWGWSDCQAGPPNHQALYYIILYQKTDSLDLKESAQEFIQRNERRQAFFGKYN